MRIAGSSSSDSGTSGSDTTSDTASSGERPAKRVRVSDRAAAQLPSNGRHDAQLPDSNVHDGKQENDIRRADGRHSSRQGRIGVYDTRDHTGLQPDSSMHEQPRMQQSSRRGRAEQWNADVDYYDDQHARRDWQYDGRDDRYQSSTKPPPHLDYSSPVHSPGRWGDEHRDHYDRKHDTRHAHETRGMTSTGRRLTSVVARSGGEEDQQRGARQVQASRRPESHDEYNTSRRLPEPHERQRHADCAAHRDGGNQHESGMDGGKAADAAAGTGHELAKPTSREPLRRGSGRSPSPSSRSSGSISHTSNSGSSDERSGSSSDHSDTSR